MARLPVRAIVLAVVVLGAAACRPVPGPVDLGFVGTAYPVPSGTGTGALLDQVPVFLVHDELGYVGTEYLPAGQGVSVEVVGSPWGDLVSMEWDDQTTALAPASSFWAMPTFVDQKDLLVSVDGTTTLLGDSGLRYHRRTPGTFDDPATPGHDGVAPANRDYLACSSDRWSIGVQVFTADFVELGLHRRDRVLVEKGVVGLDWGVGLTLDDEGVHWLHRDCDGATVADYGGSHHTSQWLEALGRAVYLLAASEWAGEYRSRIETYVDRIELIAARLTQPDVYTHWWDRWLHSGDDPYTHKTYMRAAGLGLAATLTDDADDATRWAEAAAEIARYGMDQQWPDGVNPELGGYDVSYQAYGVWLAELYHSTLGPEPTPLRADLEAAIGAGIGWMASRVDPVTGQTDIGDSTRTCVTADGYPPYDAAVAVRAFLLWGDTRPGRADLVDLAVLTDHGRETTGNPCPS